MLFRSELMETWAFYRSLCGIVTTPLLECEKLEKSTLAEVQELARRIKLDTVYFLKGKEEQNG